MGGVEAAGSESGRAEKVDTKVEIFGQSYVIRGEADSEYTQKLAEYVDKKMREVATKASSISSLNAAILAALNIANELFELAEKRRLESDLIDEKATALLTLLEEEV